jgi:hypothetical protein
MRNDRFENFNRQRDIPTFASARTHHSTIDQKLAVRGLAAAAQTMPNVPARIG